MDNELTQEVKDFTTLWIFSQYELGRPVSEIAAEMKISESKVYAKMRVKPKTYEEAKKAREEQSDRRVRRISGMADGFVLSYMEGLNKKKDDPDLSDEEKQKVFAEIDRVARIGKQYSERILLAEGKATANAGNAGGLPFRIVVTKTYETVQSSVLSP
jgi:hypothetical protein